jgi:hypothetical protein
VPVQGHLFVSTTPSWEAAEQVHLQETALVPGLVFSNPNAGEMNTSPNSINAPIIFIFASGDGSGQKVAGSCALTFGSSFALPETGAIFCDLGEFASITSILPI